MMDLIQTIWALINEGFPIDEILDVVLMIQEELATRGEEEQ